MATTSGSSWDTPRAARVGGLVVAGAVLLFLAGWAVFAMVVPERCSIQPMGGVVSFALVSASIGGFVAGHLLGRWLESSSSVRPPSRRESASRGALLVQAGLVLLLTLSAALLVYETLALVDTQRNWPITFFVRCFANSNPVWAGIGSAAFCFLLGHWVWYPAGDDRD